ncbi:hypothetical protein C1N91_14390 [Curtobacterium sp. SGAir0471]|nr:hypothetical protein C1N91_14390 [Curtobacterium sp. SGAir0471]
MGAPPPSPPHAEGPRPPPPPPSPPHAEGPRTRAACGALPATGTRSPCHPWGRRPAWPRPSRACRRRRPRS